MTSPQTLLTVDGEAISADQALALFKQNLGVDPAAKEAWYAPILNELQIRKIAQREGIPAITDAELQAGVDATRAALGLNSVADTEAWFATAGIELADFERGVETSLLWEKWAEKAVGSKLDQLGDLDEGSRQQMRKILMQPILEAEQAKTQVQIGG